VDGLQAAIQNYKERHGLITERKPTTEEVVRQRLKRVMNPVVGLDLVRTEMVNDIALEDGTVRVEIDLSSDHQFANNISEEIHEKLDHLWDVDKVVVEFTE
jgi:metal-sulfur cluster biosynthetic enzyme